MQERTFARTSQPLNRVKEKFAFAFITRAFAEAMSRAFALARSTHFPLCLVMSFRAWSMR